MNTSVTSYGYKVLKKELSSEQISKIKKDMMIMPYVYDPVKNHPLMDLPNQIIPTMIIILDYCILI